MLNNESRTNILITYIWNTMKCFLSSKTEHTENILLALDSSTQRQMFVPTIYMPTNKGTSASLKEETGSFIFEQAVFLSLLHAVFRSF